MCPERTQVREQFAGSSQLLDRDRLLVGRFDIKVAELAIELASLGLVMLLVDVRPLEQLGELVLRATNLLRLRQLSDHGLLC